MRTIAVRHEKIILSVEDHASRELLQTAAAAKTLDKSLDGVNRTSTTTNRGIDNTGTTSKRTSQEIDRLSGRLRLFRDIGITLGPAFVPIGAVAIPAVAGLAAQLGAAALAGGTAVVAFQGVGEALEAVNDAALDPTIANLEKARTALAELGPEARQFVGQMQELRPVFDGLSDAAGAGLFPGLTAAFEQFDTVAPRLEGALRAIGDATGDLVNDFATGISGSRGAGFIDFLRDEVPSILTDLGHTMGNFTAGLAELWQAFTPLNRDFSGWMLNASAAFDDWATGLAQTEGFSDFVAYLRDNGPRVAEALGAIGSALVNIVTAAAPLGGPVLMAVEAIADMVATIAGSDAGPAIFAAVTAMTLLTRSTATYGKVAESAWGQAMRGQQGAIAQMSAMRSAMITGGAAVAGMGLSMVDLRDSTNAAAQAFDSFSGLAGYALLGFAAGGPVGAAIGGGIGLITELTGATRDLRGALVEADDAMTTMDTAALEAALANVNAQMARQEGITWSLTGAMPLLGLAHRKLGDNTDEAAAKARQLNIALAATEGRTTGVESAFFSARTAGKAFADMADRQAEKMRETRQAAGGVADEFIDLANEADNAKVSLAQWLRQLERQAEALRDFRVNAQQAAERGLRQGLIKELQELGPVGALRMRQLANATDKEIARANQAWQSAQRETRLYKDSILDIPKNVETKVTVNTGAAIGAIMGLRGELNRIPDETVYINVKRGAVAGAALGSGVPDDAKRQATGGPVYGPGTGTSDSIPAWLSNGEHVWTAREVANAGGHAAVKAMRDQFRYAMGGAVGQRAATPVVNVAGSTWSGTVSLSDGDLVRLAQHIGEQVRVGAFEGTSGREQARNRSVRGQVRSDR